MCDCAGTDDRHRLPLEEIRRYDADNPDSVIVGTKVFPASAVWSELCGVATETFSSFIVILGRVNQLCPIWTTASETLVFNETVARISTLLVL